MAEPTLLAAAQFRSVAGACAENLEAAAASVRKAAALGAGLVVLPEFCLSGYQEEWIRRGAPGGGTDEVSSTAAPLVELSASLGLTVVVNDLERAGGDFYSTSYVLAAGQVVGRHRKTVLTRGEQRAGLTPGNRAASPVTTTDLPVPVAPMVCYEHGFPEIALHLALEGAGVIAISSAISQGTEYLRNLRTRARAQDNGCYVVAANAVGDGYCGESMIADPRGDVVARASASDCDVIVATLDPGLIEEERRKEPVLQLRRPELHPGG